jgi:hypothetical protein
MKVRNTTDFDTQAIRSWLRRVVRHVEATFVKGHPLGWSEQAVRARATLILTHPTPGIGDYASVVAHRADVARSRFDPGRGNHPHRRGRSAARTKATNMANSYGYKVTVTDQRLGEHEQTRVAVVSWSDLVLCEVTLTNPTSEQRRAALSFALKMMRGHLLGLPGTED